MLAMLLIGIVLCVDVAYFIRGSLEEFPSAEDDEKIRIVTAIVAVPLLAGEILLWRLLRLMKRT